MKKYIYADIIRAAISDFEEFFTEDSDFHVNFRFENMREIATTSGNSSAAVIKFNKFSTDTEISSLDDIFLCLLIVGHELAHYVNRHNSHIDVNKSDSVAIEGWADYFGARVTLSIITYGKKISDIVFDFTSVPFASPASFSWRQDRILHAMGIALSRAYESVYRQGDGSGYYMHSSLRACSFLGGVVSYFYRSMGELNEKWFIYIMEKLVINNKLGDAMYDPRVEFVPDDYFHRVRKIHINLKGRRDIFITKGLKSEYLNVIGTSYVDDADMRAAQKKRIDSQLKKWSLNIVQ